MGSSFHSRIRHGSVYVLTMKRKGIDGLFSIISSGIFYLGSNVGLTGRTRVDCGRSISDDSLHKSKKKTRAK